MAAKSNSSHHGAWEEMGHLGADDACENDPQRDQTSGDVLTHPAFTRKFWTLQSTPKKDAKSLLFVSFEFKKRF